MLSANDQTLLLRLARERIQAEFEDREPRLPPRTEGVEAHAGAFVTITNPDMRPSLRGCIGQIEATEPVYDVVARVAFQAAFRDPRFHQVTREELPKIHLEITILSAPCVLGSVNEIVIGRDGLIVSRGRSTGVLLPQVASERGWDREEFLSQTCRKAGLPLDAWLDAETVIEVFSGYAFDEPVGAVHLSEQGHTNAASLGDSTGSD